MLNRIGRTFCFHAFYKRCGLQHDLMSCLSRLILQTINILLAHFRSLKMLQIFSMLLGIMPAAPPLPRSPLISSYQVVGASFQSTLVGPCIHTHLTYNVISAYLIEW